MSNFSLMPECAGTDGENSFMKIEEFIGKPLWNQLGKCANYSGGWTESDS